MSFFKANKSAEAVKDSGGGGAYISKSGMYDITINNVFVDENEKGAKTLHFFLTSNDQPQTLYNAIRMENNDGSQNFQIDLLNKLMAIVDLDTLSDPEEVSLPIGKEGADKEVYIIPELCDLDITMRVQMEYSLYQGEIKEKAIIKNFYRTSDNATAAEIINEVPKEELGSQFEKELKYQDRVTYNDELTAEDVEEWINAGRPKESAKKPTKSAPKRRFGSK